MKIATLLPFIALLVACDDGSTDVDTDWTPVSTLAGYALGKKDGNHWWLPDDLEEISGLAVTADDRLFAHNDEEAVVFGIDFEAGAFTKIFWLDDPPVRDDFEGLATDGNHFYLITAAGTLYRFLEGMDGEAVAFEVFETGLDETCEVEGLAYHRMAAELLIACKEMADPDLDHAIRVYRWSVVSAALVGALFERDDEDVRELIDRKRFNPSGIEVLPAGDRVVLIAARQRGIAEFSLDGRLLGAGRLAKKHHRQVEGIAILGDGRLILGDEGEKRSAKLSIYGRRDGR